MIWPSKERKNKTAKAFFIINSFVDFLRQAVNYVKRIIEAVTIDLEDCRYNSYFQIILWLIFN